MNNQLFFEIPDNQEVMTRLVESVPSNWSWVDGELHAPKHLIDSGQVEENTGFALERAHEIHPTIIGSYDRSTGKRRKPNLFAIMVKRKLPGFIKFDEAGFNAHIVTLKLAKAVAVGFIQNGYRGKLHFFKGWDCDDKYDNDARCEMIFEPWHGAPCEREEAGTQPARIQLVWNRSCERNEDITPIIAACRLLNLRQYSHVDLEKLDF